MNWLRDMWLYIREPNPWMRNRIRDNQRQDQELRRSIKRDLRDLT